jgi:hypothetical protein
VVSHRYLEDIWTSDIANFGNEAKRRILSSSQ